MLNADQNDQQSCGTCGHARLDHIYEEGPCRPGFACPSRCEAFAVSDWPFGRFSLGWLFGWPELMDTARRRAAETGRRQSVRRDGSTWVVSSKVCPPSKPRRASC